MDFLSTFEELVLTALVELGQGVSNTQTHKKRVNCPAVDEYLVPEARKAARLVPGREWPR